MDLATRIPNLDDYSTADRLRLIEELWDSLPQDLGTMDVPQSHKEELDRRLAAMQADPLAGSSWSEVKARLQRQARDER